MSSIEILLEGGHYRAIYPIFFNVICHILCYYMKWKNEIFYPLLDHTLEGYIPSYTTLYYTVESCLMFNWINVLYCYILVWEYIWLMIHTFKNIWVICTGKCPMRCVVLESTPWMNNAQGKAEDDNNKKCIYLIKI